jgi:multidrug efflux pump subunit AcrB
VNRAIAWFAHNPVAANLLLFLILLGGVVTLPGLRREIYPEISADAVTISVEYRGAAPAEIESAICIRIEEKLQGTDGVERVTSTAQEGFGVVTAELAIDADPRRALDDIKARVDAIDTFPEEAEKPVIQRVVVPERILELALSGRTDEATLATLGRRLRDEIATLPGITRVEVRNARPYEVSIEISESALRRYGLTFDAVARAVRRSSLDLPGGSIKSRGGEVLLRTKGQAYRGADFARLPILSRVDGTRLAVSDVATVVDGFEEVDRWARFDGDPALMIRVYRIGQQNALEITRAVRTYVDEARRHLPEGVELTLWYDRSEMLRDRLTTLLENGADGFLLVLIVLALFLRLRVAFWILFGLPLCFLGTLWWMPAFDVSINSNSLFAFILVLGILVDDAIVIGENIFTHHESKGWSPRAAVEGAQEVAVPVVFGVLTTAAAFAPLLLIPGTMGRLMAPIPICVLLTLAFSLLESTLILPSHLAHGRDRDPHTARWRVQRWWRAVQGGADSGLQWFIARMYRPALEVLLRWRYLTLASALALFLLAAGVLAGGWLSFVFIPSLGGDHVIAALSMPLGTPARVTSASLTRLERSARRAGAAIDGEYGGAILAQMYTAIGEQSWGGASRRSPVAQGQSASHLGEVVVKLAPERERAVAAAELLRRWRAETGSIPDAVELAFTANVVSAGEPVNIQLRGPDIEALRDAAAELRAHLAEHPGLVDITDSFRGGKRELVLDIEPTAQALGLTLADLGRQVRQAFYGEEVQRIQRGRDEVRVMLRYPRQRRRSLADIENMFVRTAAGAEVPFRDVARVAAGSGFALIQRADRQRIVNVTADIDPRHGNANEIIGALRQTFLPELVAHHPGMSYSFEGEQREQSQTLGALGRGALLSLLAIYALLAIPLRSYVQPLLIMSAIPFGMIGAIAGHLLLGYPLSMSSLMGLVALAGVVVNDSLVLVSYVNQQVDNGLAVPRAVREAGAARFRAILLTSLTTFAGLVPIMSETSFQAQLLVPMAVSLAFGVIFATAITLFLVPALYLILDDLRAVFGAGGRAAP